MLRMYEDQPVVYGVIVGDGGKTMIVRGLEIQKRVNILGRLNDGRKQKSYRYRC